MGKSLQEALKEALGGQDQRDPEPRSKGKVRAASAPKPKDDSGPQSFLAAMESVTPMEQANRIQLAAPPKSLTPTGPKVRADTGLGKTVRQNKQRSKSKPSVEKIVKGVLAKLDSRRTTPRYLHVRDETPKPAETPPRVELLVGPSARIWRPERSVTAALLRIDGDQGAAEQLCDLQGDGSRDVVMGIDFGTSATKVVIGDRTLKQAYAVPFRDATGITSYVLPSVLFESGGKYSLERSPDCNAFPGLKLALLQTPDDGEIQARIAAFVALVARSARSWLFDKRREEYQTRQIVWSICIGQAADHSANPDFEQVYRTIAAAAWKLSAIKGSISIAGARDAVREAGAEPTGIDVDVLAIPEIAAQIYGFITSNHFDPAKRNIYLLADVGAGTLDSCLFRLIPGKYSGEWELEVYTSAVREHGVMNLHGYRIAWFQRELESSSEGLAISRALDDIKLPIEQGGRIPPRFRDYLDGVEIRLSGSAKSPDQEFYDDHVLKQVLGQTLYHAYISNVLPREDLGGVPFFLCGGGSRMPFYEQLRQSLPKVKNFSWLGALGQELALPKDLIADGVARSDFDRLSVAYGLSQLTLASAQRARPMPRASSSSAPEIPEWRGRFVDKDQV